MNGTTLLRRNLTRNPLRMSLTVAAIALPMFLYILAQSWVHALEVSLGESDKHLRVSVHQKLTFTAELPQRIRGEIESIAPAGYVTSICRMAWFGGRVPDSDQWFQSAGVDRDTFAAVYHNFELSEEEIELFQSEKRGAVVGVPLARKMNWQVGDRVELESMMLPGQRVEFIIVAIPKNMGLQWLYFGLDYYDDVAGEARGVNNFWIKCRDEQARQWALTEIDRHFANSENETKSEMESQFVAGFLKSGGDLVQMVWNIGQLIVLVAVAAAFNTMSMAFRERTSELGVMRALGFGGRRIFRMVMSEGLVIGAVGGLIAVVPVFVIVRLVRVPLPMVDALTVGWPMAITALAVSIACGGLAAFGPAWMAQRIKVAPALRKVV
jgi:putative ABC transport system permease protein